MTQPFSISIKEHKNNTAFTLSICKNCAKQKSYTWSNTFKKIFIEQLTKRTGNYKSYTTFIKMIKSAIYSKSNNVTFKILKLDDLKQNQNLSNNSLNSIQTQDDEIDLQKRYFIISLSVNGDKVHYPMPLIYQEESFENSCLTSFSEVDSTIKPTLNSTLKNTENIAKIQFDNQQELIEKQKRDINQLEEKLLKRGKIIKQLKAEIETLKKEKKLLNSKYNTLLLESAENKRRGRSIYKSHSRPCSREPSPRFVNTRSRSYERPWSQNRARSYDRPWLQTSRERFNKFARSSSEERFGRNTQNKIYKPSSRPSSLNGHQNFQIHIPGKNFRRDYIYQSKRSSSVTSQRSIKSNVSSRSSSIGRFNPSAYIEAKRAKQKQSEIRKRSKIRSLQNQNKPPLMYFNDKLYRQPKDFVEMNKSSFSDKLQYGSPGNESFENEDYNNIKKLKRHEKGDYKPNKSKNLFNGTIDIDMANIDARLNALQDYIDGIDD